MKRRDVLKGLVALPVVAIAPAGGFVKSATLTFDPPLRVPGIAGWTTTTAGNSLVTPELVAKEALATFQKHLVLQQQASMRNLIELIPKVYDRARQ